ncbi:SIR2 family protein [Mycobacteroides abscessus]|uniref:SIR2 family protein n=1 Tax=Mycobacteroides abscessus TaxID=36809 RepID=UPI00160398B0|nr:SIR2 family protein [Mycobacteroides abscessus]
MVDLGTFSRQWAVEGRRIAWLFGAGASASARVPTAGQIVLDLLSRLYADAHHLVLQDLNLGDEATRRSILSYYDGMNGMPSAGDPSDYSTAFSLALPDDGPRRQYLRGLFKDRSPSYGQRVLGALIAEGLVDLGLTTNFDDLIEQAADSARAVLSNASRPRLGIAALGDPARAGLALSDDDFPLLVKLHGDFREHHLKNLDSELQAQDGKLRQAFLDASRRFGLAVIGYSGRDASVMTMLNDAVATNDALPGGLWWMTRDPSSALPAVSELMNRADAAGVTARFVTIENFDETFASLGRVATLKAPLRSHVDQLRTAARVVDAALPAIEAGDFPILRMNALPILSSPTRALQATLQPRTTLDAVRDGLHATHWRGAHATSGDRVLALGSATQLASALPLTAPPFEVTIDCHRADAPTLERAVTSEALARGLARRLPVRALIRDRGHQLVVTATRTDRPDSPAQATARQALANAYGSSLTGLCPTDLGRGPDGQRRSFAEGVRLNVEWRLDQLWLLFVPHTWVSPLDRTNSTGRSGDRASAWRKERWVDRRNETWAQIIAAWASILAPAAETRIAVLPSGPDSDAIVSQEFVLSSTTAYSRVAR